MNDQVGDGRVFLARALATVVSLADQILDHPVAAGSSAAIRSALEDAGETLQAAHEAALGERPTAAAHMLLQALSHVLLASGDADLGRWTGVAGHLLALARSDSRKVKFAVEGGMMGNVKRLQMPEPAEADQIAVDENIPMPSNNLPWLHMNVGDSFAYPAKGAPPRVVVRRASAAIVAARKKHPSRKHTLRTLADGTVRIWRTE